MRPSRSLLLLMLLSTSLIGCGGASGPTFMPVTGTVTYQGQPVAKAAINIMSESGPAATAQTDNDGKFVAVSSGERGVVVGKAKVMVSLVEMIGAPANLESSPEAAAEFSRLVNAGKIKYKSKIPEKYANPETTPLDIEVSSEKDKNDFQLELVD